MDHTNLFSVVDSSGTPILTSTLGDVNLEPTLSLTELKAKELAATREAKRKELSAKAFASNEELGTATGFLKQLGAAAASSLGNIGANVIDVPSRIAADANRKAYLEPESFVMAKQAQDAELAINNLKQRLVPESAPEYQINLAKLNQAKEWLSKPIQPGGVSGTLLNSVLGKYVANVPKSRQEALDVYNTTQKSFQPLTDISNTTREAYKDLVNREQYAIIDPIMDQASTDATKAFKEGNVVTGTAGWLGSTIKGLVQSFEADPLSSAVKFMESIGQTLAAVNPALGITVYGPMLLDQREKAVKEFQKEHQGKLPNAKESSIIDITASLGIASEFLGDKLILESIPLLKGILGKEAVEKLVKPSGLKGIAKEAGAVAAIPLFEGAQGGFQNLMEQYGAKQGDTPIDPKELSRSAIEEGYAAAPFAVARAIPSPVNIVEEADKGSALQASTTAIEAFKQTDGYQTIGESTTDPLEAFRSSEKVFRDTTTTPEQKEEAFNQAVKAVVNTPKFNSSAIAKNLLDYNKTLGIELNEDVSNVLNQLAIKPTILLDKGEPIVSKGIKSVGNVLKTAKDIGTDKILSDEGIKRDPIAALDAMQDKASNLELTPDAYTALKEQWLEISPKILDAANEQDKNEERQTKQDKLIKTMLALRRRIEVPDVNQSVVDISAATDRSKVEPTIKAILGSLDLSNDEITDKQLNDLITAEVLSKEEKDYIKKFKELRNLNMDEVSVNIKDISRGNTFKSLKDHLSTISESISSGREPEANRLLERLEFFRNSYIGKTNRANDAYTEMDSTGESITFQEIDPNKSLTFDPADIRKLNGAKSLLRSINSDLNYIEKALEFAKSNYKINLNKEYVAKGAVEVLKPISEAVSKVLDEVLSKPSKTALGESSIAEVAPSTLTPTESITEAQKPATPTPSTPEAQTPSSSSAPEDTLNVYWGSNENKELSNLAPRPFTYEGRGYRSVEHAYQSLKSGEFDPDAYERGKGVAKAVGKLQADRKTNIALMEKLVLASFKANPDATKLLLDTGNKTITHTQDKGIWGIEFPRILMEVRAKLSSKVGAGGTVETIKEGSIVTIKGQKEPYLVTKVVKGIYTISNGGKSINPVLGNLVFLRQSKKIVLNTSISYLDPVTSVVYNKNGSISSSKTTEAIQGIASELKAGIYRVFSKEISLDMLGKTGITKEALIKVKQLFESLPKIELKKSIFTQSKEMYDVLMENELEDLRPKFEELLLAVQINHVADSPKKDGTLIQNLEQNPLVAFMRPDSLETMILDPRIAEAIAIGAIQYAGTRSGELLFNDPMAIRGMLGYGSRENLPREAYRLLMYSGMNINKLADGIGNDIFRLLDMSISEEVFRNKVIHALGFAAIKALLDIGYVKQNKIPLVEYQSLMRNNQEDESDISENEGIGSDDDISVNTEAEHIIFIGLDTKVIEGRLEVDGEGKVVLPPEIQEAKALFDKEGTIKAKFKEVFNAAPDVVNPIITPIKAIPKYLKNTFQQLSAIAQETVKTLNSRPFKLNKEVFDRFKEAYLNEDTKRVLMESLGYTYNTNEVHASRRESVEAVNLGIQRDIDRVFEYIELLPSEDSDVFFNFELWVNGRIGITSDSGINPQASKFIRHLFPLKAFTETIDLTNKDHMDRLMQSIAQGLGKDIDTVSIEDTYQQLEEIRQTEEYKNFKKDSFDPRNIVAVMKKFKLGIHSIEAMNNLVKFDLAKAKNSKSLDITASIEWDGKTNGIAIAALQSPDLGLGNQFIEVLHALGYFTGTAVGSNYSQVMKSSLDMYQRVVIAWNDRVNTLPNSPLKAVQQKYIGSLLTPEGTVSKDARTLAKYPFMTTIFGKSAATLARDFGEVLLELIYKKLENPDLTSSQIRDINEDIRVLTGTRGDLPTNNYIDHVLPSEVERAIIASVENTYGQALSSGISSLFGNFFEYRDKINAQINTIGNLFIQKVAEAKGNDKPLTKELLKELMEGSLKEFVPNFKTANAKANNEGLVALKSSKVRTNTSVQVTYTAVTPIINTLVTNKEVTDLPNTTSHKGGIQEIQLKDSGVGALIGLIHSIDSAVAQLFLKEYLSFGVHDGFYVPISQATELGKALNQIFLDVNREYSIAGAVAERAREVRAIQNAPSVINQQFINAVKDVKDNSANLLTNVIQNMSQFAGDGITVPNKYFKGTREANQEPTDQDIAEASEEGIEAEIEALAKEIYQDAIQVKITAKELEKGRELTNRELGAIKGSVTKAFNKDSLPHSLFTEDTIKRVNTFVKKSSPSELKKLREALKCRSSK